MLSVQLTLIFSFLIKGYGKITVTLHVRAVIIVKRSGVEDEGPAVSVASLAAPPGGSKRMGEGHEGSG